MSSLRLHLFAYDQCADADSDMSVAGLHATVVTARCAADFRQQQPQSVELVVEYGISYCGCRIAA